ncbi:MAG: hypothetical protein H0U95_10655 [Bacteroidetes bacterium]|nr:hypothetical protein [Bacteroidota bacterium]
MIKKIIIYFLITTTLLYGLRYLHYKGLLKQKEGYYDKYNTAFFKKNNFNVLFLGSSRAEMHYDTRVFDSLTGANSFNLSLAGANPQIAFAALKTYLQNSKAPHYLIYEIDYHYLKYKNTEIKEFNNYFPYLSNKELRSQFSKVDARMNHFYYDAYYSFPFTGFKNISTSLHGWLNIPNQIDSLYYKGYFKESLRPALKFVHIEPYFSFCHKTNRDYIDSIISICKQNNTQVTLVSSPIFGGGKIDLCNKQQIVNQMQNIAKINNICYYDLSSLVFCNQRQLFIDHYHLNYLGAEKYTRYFCTVFNNKIATISLK